MSAGLSEDGGAAFPRRTVARSRLQGAELVVRDESASAAPDPESLERCLETVLGRAPSSLLVIARLALQLGHNLAGDLAGLFDGPGRKAYRADFRMAAAAVALANGRQVVLDLIAGPRT